MRMQIRISVRELVEFILREGDIDNRIGKGQSADAMMEGTRIHKKIQKSMGDHYTSEYALKQTFWEPLYDLVLEGRADGIFKEDEDVYIDEIKGVYRKLDSLEEPVKVHKAQAMCYGYLYSVQENLDHIGIQMTYCNIDTEDIKRFRETYSFEELSVWFREVLGQYKKWATFQCMWRKKRQESIAKLEFPFEYRKGQKKLAQDVYRTIVRKKNLFIQAPTGVGKTVTTIFPAIKAVGEGLQDRIFYLTAKTITASVALDTFHMFQEKGYRGKVIQITAKEKMCPLDEMECNPIHCPYAKGHYDRVNEAVFSLLEKEDFFTREVLLDHAKSCEVCPFEMSLDVSSWCDDIVCDYNYVFDPNVYLKRFFSEGIKGDYIFLVDEAHNLVDRSREMYSETLYKEDILLAKKIVKPYSKKLEKALDKINKVMLGYKRECENYEIYQDLGTILYTIMHVASDLDELLRKDMDFAGKKELRDIYLNIRNFLKIYDLVDEHYVIYGEVKEDGRFGIKLFCVDPSENLQHCLDKAGTTVFFSGTLLPIHYYKKLLSTKEDNYAIYAESTFTLDQRLLLMGRDVSTKYTRRNQEEFHKMARYIRELVLGKEGNYMAFFPSYKLMEQVHEEFESLLFQNGDRDITTLVQSSGMKEHQREEFLASFQAETKGTLVAFCVMGGIFGEGIDLTGDRLIGAIVVGTGLPQVNNEREILKNYYDEEIGAGFDYAYRYPGMNKVLQAAGRVIRTAEDKGVILLLDERFLQRDYVQLYPREWEDRKTVTLEKVSEEIDKFWNLLDDNEK